MPTVAEALDAALDHHRAGRLAAAQEIYRQVLAADPRQPDALHLLGLSMFQCGQHEAGLTQMEAAVRRCDSNPFFHNSLGEAYRTLRQFERATAALNRAIQLKPDHAGAHNNLGITFQNQGKLDEAIVCYRRAISFRPDFPAAFVNLATALRERGTLDEAVACCRRALELSPNYAEAHMNLGVVFKDQGKVDEAIACYRRALQLKPDYAEAHTNLGTALCDQGRLDESIACHRRALHLKPDSGATYNNLGGALRKQGKFDEATAAFQSAVELAPDCPESHDNLAIALQEAGKFDEAIAASRRGLELKPDFAAGHFSLACILLRMGDYARGWPEYEWRWRIKRPALAQRNFSQPMWVGGDLSGRRILLHTEQGCGDAIQCVRYAPLVAARGGKVIVECHPELYRLLQTLDGVDELVVRGRPLPPFDLHCPVMSLPLAFGTTVETIPNRVPYLHADPQRSGQWRARLAGDANRLKVGLVWAGNPDVKTDSERSMRLPALAPLGQAPGVSFYSLQKGPGAAQAKDPLPGLKLINYTNELQDFADTAALISQLDLVISVCTSVTHLAGALGRPVWTLLSYAPDWRWLVGREDSPWYPTMRLFRQKARGDWDEVARRVAEALKAK